MGNIQLLPKLHKISQLQTILKDNLKTKSDPIGCF